jgi:serine/threonine-protein kinase
MSGETQRHTFSDIHEVFDAEPRPTGASAEAIESGRLSSRPPPRYSDAQHLAGGDPYTARPGDVLASRYVVEQPPIRSSNVLVFQVRHADLGQRFTLKCLLPEASVDPDAVARFLRGARAAIHLTSEHTARTVDAGRFSSNVPYIVSEALTGCDLRETLRVRGVLAPNEAVDLVLQACEALAEAHANGLVHRNLSLSTLFATRRPGGTSFVKVLDFGVADVFAPEPARNDTLLQFARSSNSAAAAIQSLECYSPEQIRSSKEIDARTDIWALGAILHELLAGSPVFQAPTVPALLAAIAADPPVPITSIRSDVPGGLETVVLRCLEKERSARYPSVADFAVALRSFATPEAKASIERITRTLAQSRSTVAPVGNAALVHVGPAAAYSELPPAPPAPAPANSSTTLLLVAAIVALGQVGGMVAAVFVADRNSARQVAGTMVTDVSRAQPAPEGPHAGSAASAPGGVAALGPAQPVAPTAPVAQGPAPASSAGTGALEQGPKLPAPRPARAAPRVQPRAPESPPEQAASVRPDLFDSVQ